MGEINNRDKPVPVVGDEFQVALSFEDLGLLAPDIAALARDFEKTRAGGDWQAHSFNACRDIRLEYLLA